MNVTEKEAATALWTCLNIKQQELVFCV